MITSGVKQSPPRQPTANPGPTFVSHRQPNLVVLEGGLAPKGVLKRDEISVGRLLEKTKILVWQAEAVTWRFTYVSPQAKMLVGYPVTDWYQPDFLDLHIHPEDKHKMYCEERLQPGAQYDLTFRMLASDGRIVWFHNLVTVNADDAEPSLLSGFMIDISERQRAEEVLQDLGGRLIEAQENERSRIARELHDDFNQRLALLSIELGQLGKTQTKQSVREACQKLQRQAQQLSADLHLLSYRLHPAKLDHLGLAAAVRSLCEELSMSTNLTIEFHQHGFPAVLSKEVALCIFRIAQEALRNCVKHSRAKSAQLFLWKTRGAVHVSISDDGCGFDSQSENTDKGLGFISMKERLHVVGGNLQISSQPHHGTCIKASVPTP